VKPLFGYGTFRKAAWREAILGAQYPAQPATLPGYRRVACASGYLSLRETVMDVGLVEGILIELDEVGWRVADAWEEVPIYHRVEVAVNTMHGCVDAVAYFCLDATHVRPIEDDRLALLTDAEVEASIEIFAAKMRRIRAVGDAPASGDDQQA
jgi:gamma-glutamylcyclotransferase (GGCT)/AIG2-like uncharacterized protein YtfP